ncbi:unnamed protein product (mitochondrion) [Plasmodiophora brassicae]|uniref:Uncharacterized protein n=1 Tax=Plasmodiophora brassicae TaxID=37360 RepID=A0A3P3YF99_PLABS|nr:unnamed protein product [Plasmodiophora brassicae]
MTTVISATIIVKTSEWADSALAYPSTPSIGHHGMSEHCLSARRQSPATAGTDRVAMALCGAVTVSRSPLRCLVGCEQRRAQHSPSRQEQDAHRQQAVWGESAERRQRARRSPDVHADVDAGATDDGELTAIEMMQNATCVDSLKSDGASLAFHYRGQAVNAYPDISTTDTIIMFDVHCGRTSANWAPLFGQ